MKQGTIWLIVAVVALVIVFTFVGGTSTLTLSFTNLEPLEQGHYEGWAIYGEEKVSTGKFDVGDELVFSVDGNLRRADQIVVTIEPEGDVDSEPSGVVVLAGDVSGGEAGLTFPVDLSSASGNYILATPTNGDGTFERSGIWFLELPEPSAGLVLPELPDGWVYEGWAVFEGTPITSGRFSSPEGADDFDGFSGTEAGPPFPGEDFLVNAPNGLTFPIALTDGTSKVVVSVEPDINGEDPTGDGPFQVKPLVADIPFDADDHVNFGMNLDLGTVPSGMAVF